MHQSSCVAAEQSRRQCQLIMKSPRKLLQMPARFIILFAQAWILRISPIALCLYFCRRFPWLTFCGLMGQGAVASAARRWPLSDTTYQCIAVVNEGDIGPLRLLVSTNTVCRITWKYVQFAQKYGIDIDLWISTFVYLESRRYIRRHLSYSLAWSTQRSQICLICFPKLLNICIIRSSPYIIH